MKNVLRTSRRSSIGRRALLVGAAVLAVGAAALALPATAPPAGAVPPATTVYNCDSSSPSALASGSYMQPGGCLVSPNHQYELIMQQDGNLVLYYQSQSDPLWNSGTQGHPGAYLTLQTDGNLIVNDTNVLWASGTNGTPNPTLVLQNDGNLVVYGENPGGFPYAPWSTNTENLRGYQLQPGELLQPGQYLESTNGQYTLSMSSSGYLMLASRGSYLCPLWFEPAVVDYASASSVTTYQPQNLSFGYTSSGSPSPSKPTGITSATPTPNAYLAMQTDGNLVLYPQGVSAPALWAVGTSGNPGASVTLGGDGNVVVMSTSGATLWQSGTNTYRGAALCTDDTLQQGDYLGFSSQGGQSAPTLVMQSDCNLVLYVSTNGVRKALWSSNTSIAASSFSGETSDMKSLSTTGNFTGCYTVMQDDGNLAMYAPNYAGGVQAMWSSGSSTGSNSPPTGRPFIGPFWLQIYNPYLVVERWGVGTGWKADPTNQIAGVSANANTSTGSVGSDLITGVNFALTNNYYSVSDLFESLGWL